MIDETKELKLEGKTEQEVLEKASKIWGTNIDDLTVEFVGEVDKRGFLGIFHSTTKEFIIRHKKKKIETEVKNEKFDIISESTENVAKVENNDTEKISTTSKNKESRKYNFHKKPTNIDLKNMETFKKQSEDITIELCKYLGVTVDLKTHVKGKNVFIKINAGEEDGLIIGKNGITLSSLQHIVNRIVNVNGDMPGQIVLDISDYRSKKDHFLTKKARQIAASVKKKKKEIIMEHLLPNDRRIIHLALKNDSGVKTYTIGSGHNKKIVIAPIGKELYHTKRTNVHTHDHQ